jgi:hypothetical protein
MASLSLSGCAHAGHPDVRPGREALAVGLDRAASVIDPDLHHTYRVAHPLRSSDVPATLRDPAPGLRHMQYAYSQLWVCTYKEHVARIYGRMGTCAEDSFALLWSINTPLDKLAAACSTVAIHALVQCGIMTLVLFLMRAVSVGSTIFVPAQDICPRAPAACLPSCP